MGQISTNLPIGMTTSHGASEDAMEHLVSYANTILKTDLPNDYLEFLKQTNGFSGKITQNASLFLWSAEIVPELNNDYKVPEWAPGLLLIGSDEGAAYYGINTRSRNGDTMSYCQPDFLGMGWDTMYYFASSFEEFLLNLSHEG